MRRLVLAVALVAVGIILGTSAKADVELSYDQMDGLAPHARKTKTEIYIGKDSLKFVLPDSEYIFLGATNTFYAIDLHSHTYQLFSAVTRKQIFDKEIDEVKKDSKCVVPHQAAHPPPRPVPDQPHQGELSHLGSAYFSPPWQIDDKMQTFAPWKCKLLRRSSAPWAKEEVCLATPAEIGITDADWKTIANFGKALADAWPALLDSVLDYRHFETPQRELDYAEGLRPEGFPVAFLDLNNGDPLSTETLVKVEHIPLPKDAFDIPPGFIMRSVNGRPAPWR